MYCRTVGVRLLRAHMLIGQIRTLARTAPINHHATTPSISLRLAHQTPIFPMPPHPMRLRSPSLAARILAPPIRYYHAYRTIAAAAAGSRSSRRRHRHLLPHLPSTSSRAPSLRRARHQRVSEPIPHLTPRLGPLLGGLVGVDQQRRPTANRQDEEHQLDEGGDGLAHRVEREGRQRLQVDARKKEGQGTRGRGKWGGARWGMEGVCVVCVCVCCVLCVVRCVCVCVCVCVSLSSNPKEAKGWGKWGRGIRGLRTRE